MNGGFREVRQDADGGLRKLEIVFEWWWYGSTQGCRSSQAGSGLGGDTQRGHTETKDLGGGGEEIRGGPGAGEGNRTKVAVINIMKNGGQGE